MRITKAIRKYLAAHAEPDAEIARFLRAPFAHALVVPAYGEGDGVVQVLSSVPRGPRGEVLVVLVINAPAGAHPPYAEANRETFIALEREYGAPTMVGQGVRAHPHPRGTLVVIDRTGKRALLPRQGVGLARKIGFDFALSAAVHTRADLRWLHGTDADARLPSDYFEAAGQELDGAALVYPFRHETDTVADAAVYAYEASLRYYVLGLRHAESPCAFHTVGSLVSVTPHAYAAVRGVPKRNGAEDFYLLNKVQKVGPVVSLTGAPIVLAGRASARVPFGTGPSVARIAETDDPWAFPVYHPAIFDRLKERIAAGIDLDAKQTLQLVHQMREREYPSLPLRRAIAEAPFIRVSRSRDLTKLCRGLAELEAVQSLRSPNRSEDVGHGIGHFPS